MSTWRSVQGFVFPVASGMMETDETPYLSSKPSTVASTVALQQTELPSTVVQVALLSMEVG